MMILTGNSLNERHRELNSKVNEVFKNGESLDNVLLQVEKSDVDRLFKINLANKCKNVEYIIKTLKCGDSLYISKALKCAWLYDDQFSNIINPDYLEQNIFPEMSFKMKRKFLNSISMHLTNDRAAHFYSYCVKIKLPNIAIKFLLCTSEAFKLEVIKEKSLTWMSPEDIIKVIGNSFTLATAVLDDESYKIIYYLKGLSYLYSVSDIEYLDLVEKYIFKHNLSWPSRLGLRTSKNIIKKHKYRLFHHTSLYTSMLNKKMLIKYSSPDDVKIYLKNLLPPRCLVFWNINFYSEYSYLLDVIPFDERLKYIKHIFITHYPEEEFEMNIQFYHSRLYTLMSKEERESWALKHVESDLEHFGHGKDFYWYKFVAFEKAFVAIKKYILVAADADVRIAVVNVLVKSAKCDRELEALFKYYYQRFVNEMIRYKEKFIDKVLNTHKYFDFDEDCWNAFDKILHSMDVYDNLKSYTCRTEYKLIAMIYAIINQKELHDVLKQHIDDGIYMYALKQQTDKFSEEKAETVYQYIMDIYMKKINSFDINKYDDHVKNGVRKYMQDLLHLMYQYNKHKRDIPEIVMKYIALDPEEYNNNQIIREETETFTQINLIKDLKKDASLVVSKIPLVNAELMKNNFFDIGALLKKMKIYFSNDIVLNYIELFKKLLTSDNLYEKTCDAAIYGIFHLAENTDVVDFVAKYIPTDPKIDHDTIDRKLLYIRLSICKLVCLSRPIVPLSTVQKYIVGDYLKFCLPMFQSYAANLQPPLFIEFVKFLLKSPASIQKHGIRLAFKCFNVKDLKTIVLDTWKNTKNISLRLVMYQGVTDKIINEDDKKLQKELFAALKTFTLDLREDDDNALFELLTKAHLPSHILGEHLLNSWDVLNTLANKPITISRKAAVVNKMAEHVDLMEQDKIKSIISEHINFMLKLEQIKISHDTHTNDLIEAKWNLTAKYLPYIPNEEILEQNLKILETIIKECIKLWDHKIKNVYSIRAFIIDFIKSLQSSICCQETNYCLHGLLLLKQILKDLQEALPLVQIYELIWYLRLSVIAGKVIVDGQRMLSDKGDSDRSLIFDECIDTFAGEFASLLNEFIESGTYYASSFCLIGRILRHFIINLKSNLPFEAVSDQDYIYIVICSKLVQIEKFETYQFALEILPMHYVHHGVLQEYRNVINKMKSFDNDEIKYFVYRKFVSENQYKSTIVDIAF